MKIFIFENFLRSGVIPLLSEGDEDETDSSKPFAGLERFAFESTSFSDELKNFARVDMVEM